MRLSRDDCTLHPDGPGIYHVKPTGSDHCTATIRSFPNNRMFQRWAARPYNDRNARWVWRSTAHDAITYALTELTPPTDS